MFTAPLDLPALLEEAAPEGDEKDPDIGHIHLMTADVGEAVSFWRDGVGLDERQRFGPSAAFLAEGLYHHHIGANSWHSAGAGPAPADRPGLESFELRLRSDDAVGTGSGGTRARGRRRGGARGLVAFRDVDQNLVLLTTRDG